jgi:hypothetical protein
MALGDRVDAFNVDGVKFLLLAMNVSCGNLGVLNGGGWRCIYSHQSRPSHCPLSANH